MQSQSAWTQTLQNMAKTVCRPGRYSLEGESRLQPPGQQTESLLLMVPIWWENNAIILIAHIVLPFCIREVIARIVDVFAPNMPVEHFATSAVIYAMKIESTIAMTSLNKLHFPISHCELDS